MDVLRHVLKQISEELVALRKMGSGATVAWDVLRLQNLGYDVRQPEWTELLAAVTQLANPADMSGKDYRALARAQCGQSLQPPGDLWQRIKHQNTGHLPKTSQGPTSDPKIDTQTPARAQSPSQDVSLSKPPSPLMAQTGPRPAQDKKDEGSQREADSGSAKLSLSQPAASPTQDKKDEGSKKEADSGNAKPVELSDDDEATALTLSNPAVLKDVQKRMALLYNKLSLSKPGLYERTPLERDPPPSVGNPEAWPLDPLPQGKRRIQLRELRILRKSIADARFDI